MCSVCQIQLWFYRTKGKHSWVQSFTGSDVTHVCLSVNNCVYNISSEQPSGWYSIDTFPEPDIIISIPCSPFSTAELSKLPVGTKYPRWRTILWWGLLCLPPEPLTCVRVCRMVLELGGIRVKARTPFELYEEARRLKDQEILCRTRAY